MSFSGFLILFLIAALCGGIGQNIAGYKFGGCLISAGVGFIGAIIGPGGKIIQEMQLETGATINIEEVDGVGKVQVMLWKILE